MGGIQKVLEKPEEQLELKKRLKAEFKLIIEKYQNEKFEFTNEKYFEKIWVCWWQGLENAPKIVQKCINNLYRVFPKSIINVITKDNYQNYVKIDNVIMKKFEQGKISITHFSDVLRTYLICDNGGLWVDATCFVSRNIENMITKGFYSIKLPYNPNETCISSGKWCVFFIGGEKNNILFKYLKDFYIKYWNKYDDILDYYIMDYAIEIAYEEIPEIKKMIDLIPEGNKNVHYLKELLNTKFNKKKYEELIKDTQIHKLAHERIYYTEIDGEKTYYGTILN